MTATHSHSSATSPSPTPSKSASNFNLSAMRNRLPRLRSGFFQQAARMEWLDDKNIFTWGGGLSNKLSKGGSQDSLDVSSAAGEDGYFWGRFLSRSGSESSTPFRSRSNSFTMTSDHPITGLSMTSLTPSTTTSTTTTAVLDASLSERDGFDKPTFKIQDMDELEDKGLELRKRK